MLTKFFRACVKARTKSALCSLTDRQLQDIGIQRTQIDAHVESLYEDYK